MRDTRFTFVCDKEERQTLNNLSERLARSQSDVVRLLIREAARGLTESANQERLATAGSANGH